MNPHVKNFLLLMFLTLVFDLGKSYFDRTPDESALNQKLTLHPLISQSGPFKTHVPPDNTDNSEWTYRKSSLVEFNDLTGAIYHFAYLTKLSGDMKHDHYLGYNPVPCYPSPNNSHYRISIRISRIDAFIKTHSMRTQWAITELKRLPRELNNQTKARYEKFINRNAIHVPINIDYGSLINIDFRINNLDADEITGEEKDRNILKLVGLRLVDNHVDLTKYPIAERIYQSATLLHIHVVGPPYDGNIVNWIKISQHIDELYPIWVICVDYTEILSEKDSDSLLDLQYNLGNVYDDLMKEKCPYLRINMLIV